MDTKVVAFVPGDPGTEEGIVTPAQATETGESANLTRTEAGNRLRDQRIKQIDALAMQGPKKPKSKESWLNTVGQYPEDAPLSRVFDEGAKIREAERIDPC